MKKTQVFGAVLCSAALACGMALPAFAAGSVSTDMNEITAAAGGSTVIKGSTSDVPIASEIIKAEIPVAMSVVLAAASGTEGQADYVAAGNGAFQAPDKSAYKITNTGNQPIVISSVAASSAGDGWTLTKIDDTATEITSAAKNTKVIALRVEGKGLSESGTSIGTGVIAAGANLGLTVSGFTKMGEGASAPTTASDMANIVYTIAKQTA